jgi:lysophospholipase L1-like esterase
VLSFSGTSRSVTVDLASHEWSYANPSVSRIMPLGDSITSGFNSPPHWGYRGPLWSLLTNGGAVIDYQGEFQDGPSFLPDRDHQGTLYQTADQLIPLAPGLMTQYKPDVVLLMIGSNDIEAGQDAASLGDEISQILDGIAARSPGVTVYVSTLTPLSPDRTGSEVIPLANQEIRSAVAQAQAEGQRVRLVDPNLSLGDLIDGVHPNDAGNGKIAQAFFDAMIADDPGIGGRRVAITPSETIVYGSEAGDRLYGNDGSNRLDGRGGDDLVYGRSGNDRLYGGAGNDRLYGSSGDDWFYGSSGHDVFKGDSGADRIYGDSGNDSITGGTGRDIMFGGSGLDRFVFLSRSESGTTASKRDVIADFTRGDKVDLSYLDANTTRSGNQKFTFVSKFTGRPGELQWDENSKGFMVSADVNGNGIADFSIQLNTKLGSLRSSDFIL